MIIESSKIAMQSEHQRRETYERSESLTVWAGNRQVSSTDNNGAGRALAANLRQDLVTISEQARTANSQAVIANLEQEQEQEQVGATQAASSQGKGFEIPDSLRQKMLILQTLLEAFTGKKINFFATEMKTEQTNIDIQALNVQSGQNNGQALGWGIAYERSETYIETEHMSFAAQGVIKTADGKEINFSVDLRMSRMFAEHNSISFRAGDAVVVDPLVINYGGNAVGLSEQKFQFDLTMDGELNTISYLLPGSGFLALDLNGDGKINDGSELFGPQSGNGFADLAKHDSDGNGWIDANDAIYDKLRIWEKDEFGNDRLFALGEKGVGAIYLGNHNTPFDIKNSQNQLQGQVVRSGVYVNSSGKVGTVQQVDLAI